MSYFQSSKDTKLLFLLFSVCAVIAYAYAMNVNIPKYEQRSLLHYEIIEGVASSPYSFRILVPYSVEVVIKFLETAFPKKVSFILAYSVYDFLALFFSLTMLYFSTKLWFSREHAFIGVLFIALTMRIGLQDHYFQPWSLLQFGFFSLAVLLIYLDKVFYLVLLMAVSSLNRETSVFIAIMYFFSIDWISILKDKARLDLQKFKTLVLLVLVWGLIFMILRLSIDSKAHVVNIEHLFLSNTNTKMLLKAAFNLLLFLGAFWFFVILGVKNSPRLIKKISFMIPLYLITILVWGVWAEVRLLFILYPIILPLGLSFIFQRKHT